MIIAAVTRPPLVNLYLSIIFGAGQVIVGGAMAFFITRKRRWQKINLALLAIIGIWFACSGITELIVSGAELLARTGQQLSSAAAVHIRAQADLAFLIASIAVLVLGALYLLILWGWHRRQASAAANTADTAGNEGKTPQHAKTEGK